VASGGCPNPLGGIKTKMILLEKLYRRQYLDQLEEIEMCDAGSVVLLDSRHRVCVKDTRHTPPKVLVTVQRREDEKWSKLVSYHALDGRFCRPTNCEKASTPMGVARNLAALINAIDLIEPSITGEIALMLSGLGSEMRAALLADGWRVRPHKNGRDWQVLPNDGSRNDNAEHWAKNDAKKKGTGERAAREQAITDRIDASGATFTDQGVEDRARGA